jgi:hypothetical protein
MCAPYVVHYMCDTQLDVAGWEVLVNDVALDVGWELDVEVGWVKHISRYGSEWAV